jgi:hypothetical protein
VKGYYHITELYEVGSLIPHPIVTNIEPVIEDEAVDALTTIQGISSDIEALYARYDTDDTAAKVGNRAQATGAEATSTRPES